MNRQQRRAAASKARKSGGPFADPPQGSFADFPKATLQEMLSTPGVYHMIQRHESWCPTVNGGSPTDCNCDPETSCHKHPDTTH